MAGNGKANQVTKTEETETKNALMIPEGMELADLLKDAGAGNENISMDDMAMPYLTILQMNNPQVNESHSLYVDGARPGMIMNTVTRQIYESIIKPGDPQKTKPGILFVPCYYERKYVEWVPRDSGGGWVADYEIDSDILEYTEIREIQGDSGVSKRLVMKGTGNLIVETTYHYGLVNTEGDSFMECVLPFKSTALKHGRKWNNDICDNKIPGHSAQAPRWLFPYRIQTFMEQKGGNSWFSPAITKIDTMVSGDLYRKGKRFMELIKAGDIKRSAEGEAATMAAEDKEAREAMPF